MEKYPKLTGHAACFLAYAIFGVNVVLCKDIANQANIEPLSLFTMRAIGATALFWLISLFTKKEKVAKKDLGLMVLASLCGLFAPQVTFLYAIGMARTIDASILGSLTPIMTMFIAAIFLKEPLTWKKVLGVAMSFSGAIFLVLNSIHTGGQDSTTPLGVILFLLNTFSFAMYLGVFRPLVSRYSVVTTMKWMFLFSLVASLPFTFNNLAFHTDFSAISTSVMLEIGYLIVFATFIAYFLIPVGQKRIRPTIVSMYSYLQPIIATVISIIIGMDIITWQKCLAIILVFAGVWVVNQSRALQK